ncbi:hypothetical protein P700755_002114 [Psychroflexus torquis ATCC 700755]|jgi:uncharacterized membrane protein YdbT with pleckstrin-like domain|uniref:YdbS-like PH domain-containing protein n=1 Tax=Psychroflexus torquis (strain ATCC 700755 / CIP 106069 / ACAM 623) TaxID=313595 RepID=K4ITU4_PSYTT|nr:PH domain-containing protein [Psychroflexus torquis]AFU68905.1 hypothetical protein P700755_002114 [Psychroflexus torquis ATCC 700755]
MSQFVENQLLENETVLFETHHHWTNYFKFHTLWSFGLVPLLQSKLEKFVITNKRIIIRKGIILVKTIEISVDQIESVTMYQSIFQKMLGYGKITLIGTGGARYYLDGIEQPNQFKKTIQQIKMN